MPNNRQNSEDENSAIVPITPELKESFMEACSSITNNVNADLKASFKNELARSEIIKQIENFSDREDVTNQLKVKREKCSKRYQAYEATQEKLKKDREEIVESLQEHFHLFDNLMNVVQESSQNIK